MIGGSIMRNMKCKLKNNIFREKVCIFNFKQSFQNWMKRSLRAVELHVEMVLWIWRSERSDQFRLLVNIRTIEGPSRHSHNLGPLHKAIKLGKLKYNQWMSKRLEHDKNKSCQPQNTGKVVRFKSSLQSTSEQKSEVQRWCERFAIFEVYWITHRHNKHWIDILTAFWLAHIDCKRMKGLL